MDYLDKDSVAGWIGFTAFGGEKRFRVSDLKGFEKALGHKEPLVGGDATDEWLRTIGAREVKDLSGDLFSRLRLCLNFKRKECRYEELPGAISIQLPMGNLRVWIEGMPESPSLARLCWEFGSFSKSAGINYSPLGETLAPFLNWISLTPPTPLPIEQMIDLLEERSSPVAFSLLEYPPDASRFILKSDNGSPRLEADAKSLILHKSKDQAANDFLLEGVRLLDELLGGTRN